MGAQRGDEILSRLLVEIGNGLHRMSIEDGHRDHSALNWMNRSYRLPSDDPRGPNVVSERWLSLRRKLPISIVMRRSRSVR
jgi:hypothetical protein